MLFVNLKYLILLYVHFFAIKNSELSLDKYNFTLNQNNNQNNNYFDASLNPIHDNIVHYRNIHNLNKKNKRNIDNIPEQNEDIYTENLQDRDADVEIYNMVYNLGPFKRNDIGFANKFHYLLQTIVPTISNLSFEDILQPGDKAYAEIQRLHEILKSKVTLIKKQKIFKQIGINITNLENKIVNDLYENREHYKLALKHFKSLEQTIAREIKDLQEKLNASLKTQSDEKIIKETEVI